MIWAPYLESGRPVLISLGSPLFTKFEGVFFRDPKINEWDQARQSDQWQRLQEALRSPRATPSHIYTGVGEATGAFILCKLLQGRVKDLSLRRSSLLSWADVGGSNLVFLGSPKFNLHLEDIPLEEHFELGRGGIRNAQPKDGEPSIFGETWNNDRSARLEDHALVARLPGLHAQGEITVLAGRSTEATLAAVEYVTQPEYARELVKKLQRASGDIPKFYQVVIKAAFKTQVPLKISYVTHRELEPLK